MSISMLMEIAWDTNAAALVTASSSFSPATSAPQSTLANISPVPG